MWQRYIYSVANYRPITNCFIKILENIILKHLHNYLLRYNILSDDQSGFRHRDSTINPLLVIYDVIMKNLDIGKDVRFIFCDISKAVNLSIIQVSLPPPPFTKVVLAYLNHYFVQIFPPLFTYLSLLPPSLPNSLYSIINIYTEKELIHIDMVDLT